MPHGICRHTGKERDMFKRTMAAVLALGLLLSGGCARAAAEKPLSRQGFMLNTAVSIAL